MAVHTHVSSQPALLNNTALCDSEKEVRPRKKALLENTAYHKQAPGYARGPSAVHVKQLSSPALRSSPDAAQEPALRQTGNNLPGLPGQRTRNRTTEPGDRAGTLTPGPAGSKADQGWGDTEARGPALGEQGRRRRSCPAL